MRTFVAAVVACSLTPAAVDAQMIRAKDGDIILVENDDKVRIVRRRQAHVRVLHKAEQQWVLVLADWMGVPGGADGRVDWAYSFRELTGAWPLGERWEGTAYLDDYDMAGNSFNSGLGLTTSGGLIQLLSSAPPARNFGTDRPFVDPAAIAMLTFRFASRGIESGSFDIAEQRALASLAQETTGGTITTTHPGGIRTSIGMSISTAPDTPAPTQPVRVGGNLKAPTKIKHVDGVTPEMARQSGVSGMVILEIIIGTDGTVQNAKVLRSIPLLDDAAVAAVKQWVYEPSHLNGRPVSVIMTATVAFR